LDRLEERGIIIENVSKNCLFNEVNIEKNHSLDSLLKMLEGLVQLNTSRRSAIVRVLIIEDKTNNDQILIRESKINHLCLQNHIIIMHQYETQYLNSEEVIDIFKSHERVIIENVLYQSPLYMNYEEDIQGLITEQQQRCHLTQREKIILRYLVTGYTNKKISRELGISIRTVETHRNNIMSKLNARTIADLVRLALNNKII
jgi:DNA-binding CsgD family transcriptional regulator